jgi:hypothetical protein
MQEKISGDNYNTTHAVVALLLVQAHNDAADFRRTACDDYDFKN